MPSQHPKQPPTGKTPETDENIIPWSDLTDWGTGDSPYVYFEFAQELERERDSLKWQVTCNKSERDDLLREIVKLRTLLGLKHDQKVEESDIYASR